MGVYTLGPKPTALHFHHNVHLLPHRTLGSPIPPPFCWTVPSGPGLRRGAGRTAKFLYLKSSDLSAATGAIHTLGPQVEVL
jgi:hypothetical protein